MAVLPPPPLRIARARVALTPMCVPLDSERERASVARVPASEHTLAARAPLPNLPPPARVDCTGCSLLVPLLAAGAFASVPPSTRLMMNALKSACGLSSLALSGRCASFAACAVAAPPRPMRSVTEDSHPILGRSRASERAPPRHRSSRRGAVCTVRAGVFARRAPCVYGRDTGLTTGLFFFFFEAFLLESCMATD